MKTRHYWVLIMVLCASIFFISVTVSASSIDKGSCGDSVTWELASDGVLTISGSGATNDWSYSGYLLAPWNKYITSIKTVVIEEGVTGIGNYAFSRCSNLTEVIFPESLTTLGQGVFCDCTSLSSIRFPNTITELGKSILSGCKKLTNVTFPSGIKEIPEAALKSCVALKSVVIPDGVQTISYRAFLSCTALTSITIPDSVTSIMANAFQYCHALTAVVLPESIQQISIDAFSDCIKLKRINLPDGLTVLEDNVFNNCYTLEEITIPKGITELRSRTFGYCSALKKVTFLGNAPVTIHSECFNDVTANVYYPENLPGWTASVLQDYGGVLTWIPYEKEMEYTVTYTNSSISLAGDIGVNYYTVLSEDLIAAEGAYMQFTVAGQTQTVPVSEALVSTDGNGVTTHRFSCKVAAKQMTETIVGQMYLADGTPVGESKSYSVKAYCDAAIPVYSQYAAYADLVELMKAMLNYGGYSQVQFGYNTANLANADLDDTSLPTITEADVAAYAHGATGSESGISVASVSLLLESTTTIRFYFNLDGTRPITDYTFYVDGVQATPVQSGSQYYVDKVNVAAKDLDQMAEVTVGGLTARYGGLSYVRQAVVLYPSYYPANLVNVAKALYAYNQAANAYFA